MPKAGRLLAAGMQRGRSWHRKAVPAPAALFAAILALWDEGCHRLSGQVFLSQALAGKDPKGLL